MQQIDYTASPLRAGSHIALVRAEGPQGVVYAIAHSAAVRADPMQLFAENYRGTLSSATVEAEGVFRSSSLIDKEVDTRFRRRNRFVTVHNADFSWISRRALDESATLTRIEQAIAEAIAERYHSPLQAQQRVVAGADATKNYPSIPVSDYRNSA
jgi:hypothetical protein